jgi:poly(3-hydroxybutyrate) depolymerase
MFWSGLGTQPARQDFGIATVFVEGRHVPVVTRDIATDPFWTLTEFSCGRSRKGRRPAILLVSPLSGHFPYLLREVILGLLPHHRVCITNWINAAHIPRQAGTFGFTANIDALLAMLRVLGRGTTIIATCQGVVPALAATALAAQIDRALVPRALILIGGPVDPQANPTRVVQHLRARPLVWFREALIRDVGTGAAGRGRRVYPGATQRFGLQAFLARQIWEGRELFFKTLADDGLDAQRFPFLRLYSTVMDLPAEVFLENIGLVFQDRALCCGTLSWHGQTVDCRAIEETALLTIEGADDDVAAPGQTRAAHDLCPHLPARLHQHLTVPTCGHFSLIHGRRWRNDVLPAIEHFLIDLVPASTQSQPVAR